MKKIKYTAYVFTACVGLLVVGACTTSNISEKVFETLTTANASEEVVSPALHTLENMSGTTENPRAWRHFHSSIEIDRKSPIYGFRNTYANDIALKTLKAGTGIYSDGAVFATYIYELNIANGVIVPGEKIKFGFMTKDATATETGGWIFSAFGPDGVQRKIDQSKACFNVCHVPAKDKDYVLSGYIE